MGRGLSAQDIRQLFRVIDWFMDLPKEASGKFWDEIQEYEREKAMPVFTSTEKYLIDKGREEGHKEGTRETLQKVIADGLAERFGKKGAGLLPAVEGIKDVRRLHTLQKTLWTAKSIADVEKLLRGKQRKKPE